MHFHSVSFASLLLMTCSAAVAQSTDVWIGTGGKLSEGIYHCTLNTETGQLSDPTLAAEIKAPGFLTRHPSLPRLYAVGSLDNTPSVAAYAIEKTDGQSTLKFLNAVAVGDGGATHVSVDSTGRTLLTAQYGGGSVAVFSLNDDGSLKARTQLIKHKGAANVVEARQDASHAHWSGFSPDNRFAFIPDLGLDQVVIYQVDAAASKLTPHGSGKVHPGGGPRHMKFHTSGKWIYVLNELDLTVTVFDYDANAGTMTAKQTIPAVPQEELAPLKHKSASEIRVHPNGQFVYSANRGHDTISAFRVDQQTGKLSVIGREHVRGATPRNFNLDPSGHWLLAAGQDSHTLASFEVDQQTGQLNYNRSIVFAPSAICVVIE